MGKFKNFILKKLGAVRYEEYSDMWKDRNNWRYKYDQAQSLLAEKTEEVKKLTNRCMMSHAVSPKPVVLHTSKVCLHHGYGPVFQEEALKATQEECVKELMTYVLDYVKVTKDNYWYDGVQYDARIAIMPFESTDTELKEHGKKIV